MSPRVGTIINTEDLIDYSRVKRYEQLVKFFEQIYNCSKEHEITISDILLYTISNFFKRRKYNKGNKDLKKCLRNIRKEGSKQNFKWETEFLWFNDFILEKVRKDIFEAHNLILPNRFESIYFFESREDCLKYYDNFRMKFFGKIIEVQLIETNNFSKFDNNLLTKFEVYYRSIDFYNQAKFFLLGGCSEIPLFEIVFQGKYKITKYLPLN